MGRTSARDAARSAGPPLPDGDDERFSGSGVMGLAFRSGHYLASRDFAATSIGPGYRAVWHRSPDGHWTFYSTVEPELSCARYFGSAGTSAVRTPIDMTWTSADSLTVTIPGVLDWRLEMGDTRPTRTMTTLAGLMPRWAWRSNAVLGLMGMFARSLLGVGRVALRGRASNGQRFQANPKQLWSVRSSTATLDGVDIGPVGPLPAQARLADFWLPQRGLFVVAQVFFESFDADRHRAVASDRSVLTPPVSGVLDRA